MLDGALRRLLLTSFPLLVGSLLIGGSLGPLLPQLPAAERLAAHAEQASDVDRDDPQAPGDDHDPGEPVEEIGPESVESDPPLTASAAAPAYASFRLCAGVSPARTGAPRKCDRLRRLTVTSTERGPPRAASIASLHAV